MPGRHEALVTASGRPWARPWVPVRARGAEPPVSGTTVRPAAEPAGLARGRARRGALPCTPVAAVIAAAAALALGLGLRAYQIAQPGALLGVAWYDDGVYFASA